MIHKVFPTKIYHAKISKDYPVLNKQLLVEINDLENLDGAGAEWSRKNYKNGFTSYASANQMQQISTTFSGLEKKIDRHVEKFARLLDFDLGSRKLKMNTCWVNVMRKNSHHGMHIHPLSVISGTYYVQMPKGSSPIKFEDPRLSKFMASPPRKNRCRADNRIFHELNLRAGYLVLFESWIRHEVPASSINTPRISISFNYGWE